jgi:hypothetical protein
MQADAASTAIRLLEQPGFMWVGRPQPVLVEQLTYAEADRKIAPMEGDYSSRSPDTPVWFVILRGQWDLLPMGPPEVALTPVRYTGCLLSLFTVSDSTLIAVGDTACP